MAKRPKKHKVSFWHSRIISIVSISLVLFLLGVISMFILVGRGLKDYVRESVYFTIELRDNVSDAEIAKMVTDLEKEPFVRDIEYISKDDALKELSEELGESPEEFLGWNPLSASIEVRVKSEYAASRDSLLIVENSVQKYKPLERLTYKKELLDSVNKNIRTVTIVVVAFAIFLLFVSFFLINNTIRLLIYSRRFSIYTMKLVGATSGFIRRPFIRYNVVSGIIASILAVLGLTWLWFYVIDKYPIFQSVFTLKNGYIVIAIVVGFGVLISLISSFFAVNKYLRMNLDKLYRV